MLTGDKDSYIPPWTKGMAIMDLPTFIAPRTNESLDLGYYERTMDVFRAVARSSPASVSELLSETGMQESALHDALAFLREKGFVEDYIGLTPSGHGLATLMFKGRPAPRDETPVEAVARARAASRRKSTFARDSEMQGLAPEPMVRDWTMPPDRSDQRRFGINHFSDGPMQGLDEGVEAVLGFLRRNGPSRLREIAAEMRRHVKAVAEDVALLAALGLAVDVSDGAEERAKAWEAFCSQVLKVLSDGRVYPISAVRDRIPGSDFAEVKSALRYLEARGKVAMWHRGGQKVYSLPTEDGVSPLRTGGWSGKQRGRNWTRIEERVTQGPVTQPELAAELGVTSERVRQITDVLVSEGRIRLVPLRGRGRLRCFVAAGLDGEALDEALAAVGLRRAVPQPAADANDAGNLPEYGLQGTAEAA